MDSGEIHILAVDDSYLDRKVVERLLVNSSYKVTTVDSALRALEVLGIVGTSPVVINAVKINLIITDYCMPEMTGYDLLKKVKESSALKEIPVVIMSSENVAERITMCLAEGAKEFILKPLRAADVKRLRTHVRHDDDDDDSSSVFKRKPVRVLAEQLPALLKRPRLSEKLFTESNGAARDTSAEEGTPTTMKNSSDEASRSDKNNNMLSMKSSDESSRSDRNILSRVDAASPRRDEVLVSETQDLQKPVVDSDGFQKPVEPSTGDLTISDLKQGSFKGDSSPTSPRSVSSTQEQKPASDHAEQQTNET